MKRILLRFGKDIVDQPITSKIILEKETPINILTAHINREGGEILAEIERDKSDEIIKAFREHGVTVLAHNLIEVNSEECTDCGACYSLCPVGVITLEEDHSISFQEEQCLGSTCGLCVDACPAKAIRLTR
ncbi:MAG: 4Fe-4S binding protein [Thermoproteota archaeon]